MSQDAPAFGFRTTRSQKVFSPFVIKPQPGQPIASPRDFDIMDALRKENDKRMEKEDRGEDVDSEDEIELEDELEDENEDRPEDRTHPAPTTSFSSPTSCALARSLSPSPSSNSLPTPAPFHRAACKADKRRKYKPGKRAARAIQRFEADVMQCQAGMRIKRVAVKKAALAKTMPAPDLSANDLPVSAAGWTGRRQDFVKEHINLEEAFEQGLRLVDWDGDETHAIVDSHNMVISVLGAPPPGKCKSEWKAVVDQATQEIEAARKKIPFTKKEQNHRRGDFPVAAYGISFGGGQKRPGILKHSKKTTFVLQSLLGCLAFQRIAGYANCLFQAFAPRVFEYYTNGLRALQNWNTRLVPNFPRTAFAACTWNFGPFSVSYPHTDNGNVAFGWCAITSLGSYDPDRGGHLILWDLGLVIRFPPGSTILIPSALLVHSNIPIQDGETRYAFVQYSAGGLFRWIRNGFQTWEAWQATASTSMLAQYECDRRARATQGFKMFSTFSEISARYQRSGNH